MVRITGILLAYNQEDYLEASLLSLENQSRQLDELIISDDASSDSSKLIIKNFIAKSKIPKIEFINNIENKGINHCLNTAFSLVTGDLIFMQAGDDLSSLERSEFVFKVFAENPEMTSLLTSYCIIDKSGKITSRRHRSGYSNNLCRLIRHGSAMPTYGMAFRRKLLEYIAPLDCSISNEDDYIGFAAMLYGNGIYLFDNLTYLYRIHNQSVSGWSTLEMDSVVLFRKAKEQFHNRRQNWRAWHRLLCEQEKGLYQKEIRLVNSRIELSYKLENIESCNAFKRIKIACKYYKIFNYREWLWLVFGVKSILVARRMKKLVLGV